MCNFYLCDTCIQPHNSDDNAFMYCEKRWYRFKKIIMYKHPNAENAEYDDPLKLCPHYIGILNSIK